jgi:multidrug efflux pump subunit AcrB
MGFILVLGILVDDAIVVGERIYSYEQQGLPRLEAASKGTQDVTVPVVFGVFTTMATFIPILTIPGSMGGFFGAIAVTVIVALFFSIIESQFILPSHLAHRKAEKEVGGSSGFSQQLLYAERQGRHKMALRHAGVRHRHTGCDCCAVY